MNRGGNFKQGFTVFRPARRDAPCKAVLSDKWVSMCKFLCLCVSNMCAHRIGWRCGDKSKSRPQRHCGGTTYLLSFCPFISLSIYASITNAALDGASFLSFIHRLQHQVQAPRELMSACQSLCWFDRFYPLTSECWHDWHSSVAVIAVLWAGAVGGVTYIFNTGAKLCWLPDWRRCCKLLMSLLL